VVDQPSKKVFLEKPAYSTMMNFALQHKKREILGVFFGIKNEMGDIFVKEAHSFRVGGKNAVSFEDEDYIKLLPLIKESTSRNLEWLGWFHSHPFKNGDHLYMSEVDISYQFPAQFQNPFWTAIVLNPYQIQDALTNRGSRAFRLDWFLGNSKPSKNVVQLQMELVDSA
jgi:proteasome lid subunit RPN8/RPN11